MGIGRRGVGVVLCCEYTHSRFKIIGEEAGMVHKMRYMVDGRGSIVAQFYASERASGIISTVEETGIGRRTHSCTSSVISTASERGDGHNERSRLVTGVQKFVHWNGHVGE